MTGTDPIASYLREVREKLPAGTPWRERVLDEIRDHLLEARDREVTSGCSGDEGARRAIARFGSPEMIARLFASEARRPGPDRTRARGSIGRLTRLFGREPMAQKPRPRTCSFCGRTNEEVRRLIAGPNDVHICDRCVALCNEILAKEGQPTPA